MDDLTVGDGDWKQHKASRYVETKEENDLILSLRARKNKEYLVLSEAERQLLVGVLRRYPYLRDASEVGLRGMVLKLL